MSPMKRRPDIDGLRAIAIVPVLLFHAGIRQFQGGFVGVDVFFVISGYLISKLVLDDIASSRFSILRFYERRVRRILPALFVLILGTSVVACRLLTPDDALSYGKSVLATMFFSSNILFARQTGYFDAPAESNALLHTWSLAVEEQFYIFYPLFLFLISRFLRKRYVWALLLVLGTSFGYSVWAVSYHRSTAFYSAGARAWELLLGGVLALGVIPLPRNRFLENLLAVLGIGFLAYSIVEFSSSTAFPGPAALLPTIGAALLIYTGEAGSTFAARVLSTKPVVFIGLISYSLYLWHWVLLFFARYWLARSLRIWEAAAVIGASIVIASLSWKFVENPFRGRTRLIASRRLLFSVAAFASLAFASFGGLLYLRHGLPSRFDHQVLDLLTRNYWAQNETCQDRLCPVGDNRATPSFVIWGDSHAGALVPGLDPIAKANQLSGWIATSSGCAPLLGFKRYDVDDPAKCARFNDYVLGQVAVQHIGTVFLHGRWAAYSEGNRGPGKYIYLTSDRVPEKDYAVFERECRATVEQLQRLHVKVILVASVPEVWMDVPTVLARTAISGTRSRPEFPYAEYLAREGRVLALFAKLSEQYSIPIIYPHQILCRGSGCAVGDGHHAFYIDDSHLSVQGAMYVAPAFSSVLHKDQDKENISREHEELRETRIAQRTALQPR